MKSSKSLRISILVFIIVFAATVSISAWDPTSGEAPYQGSYTSWSYYTAYSKGYDMRWSQNALNDMNGDGTGEWLDQTADCTDNSPNGDKLHAVSGNTNIPNYGISIYNDCGSSSYKEESELQLASNYMNTASYYWFDMNWNCVSGGNSGEINLSFEPAWWSHDWLDKRSYYCYGSAFISNQISLPEIDSHVAEIENDLQIKPTPLLTVKDSTYSYQLIRNPHDKLYVRTDVEFSNESILKNHLDANKILLSDFLYNQEPRNDLRIVVTFFSPISIEEVAVLADYTQMHINSYGVFGRSGEDIISTYVFPINGKIEHTFIMNESVDNVVYEGIMTIDGIINNYDLERLANRTDVFLLDLSANKIQSDLRDLGENIEIEQIGIPNPAWQIYTNEINFTK